MEEKADLWDKRSQLYFTSFLHSTTTLINFREPADFYFEKLHCSVFKCAAAASCFTAVVYMRHNHAESYTNSLTASMSWCIFPPVIKLHPSSITTLIICARTAAALKGFQLNDACLLRYSSYFTNIRAWKHKILSSWRVCLQLSVARVISVWQMCVLLGVVVWKADTRLFSRNIVTLHTSSFSGFRGLQTWRCYFWKSLERVRVKQTLISR